MSDKYQIEIDAFIHRFQAYRNARIILYGIGRYTATLVNGVKDFRFVGLMDKDPANVGKRIFGLPVVDRDQAEKDADMIIINTSETYWDVIYSRIQDMGIPVFYINGERARRKETARQANPFRELSYDAMRKGMEAGRVVSFDFFDTLFLRKVCSPRDVFRLLEIQFREKWQGVFSYTELRNQAKERLGKYYSLEELYRQMEILGGMPRPLLEEMRTQELLLEKKLLAPRRQMISLVKSLLEEGKEVYIISDMYLPESFYREVLGQYGINMQEGHILLSHILHKSKEDGSLWRYFSETKAKPCASHGGNGHRGHSDAGDCRGGAGRGKEGSGEAGQALHAGDHRKADVEEPAGYGIKSYLVPAPWDLLEASSMREAGGHVCSDYGSAVMGCVWKELFENPFVLEGTEGEVRIESPYQMGYCVFGPVILTFLLWLAELSRREKKERLVFLARDGYFLKEDFDYLCGLMGEQRNCCYLGISRQLAMAASITSMEELLEYMSMPYSGSVKEMLEDRFGIRDAEENENGEPEELADKYLPEIKAYICRVRKNYLEYIGKMGLDETCAVVDLGYYGNNQKYLNRLGGLDMPGYYVNASLAARNPNAQCQKMTACFQGKDDLTGEKSRILKRQIFLESFLTAPYGMVKEIDETGSFVCARAKKNQEYFEDKEEINRGVKAFIREYWETFGAFGLCPDTEFADWYYGFCFGGAVTFSDRVKKSFYNDNAMMNRIESMLFY